MSLFPMRSARSIPAFLVVGAVSIVPSSCSSGDASGGDQGSSPIDSSVTVIGSGSTNPDQTSVEPAETGPLTDFELGGLTLEYDAAYWEIEPFGTGDPDDALVWFTSATSNAVVQLSFTNKALDPGLDACDDAYTGTQDPDRHVVTLLHEETLDNGGLLRIHEQDLDTSEVEPVVGISYAQLTFNSDDGQEVGDTFCEYSRWIEVSPRTRDDGSPVHYRVEAFFAFSMDFVYAPFKERFGSAAEMLQRAGIPETLALLETIQVAGSPA